MTGRYFWHVQFPMYTGKMTVFFPNLLFRRYKNSKTYLWNVMCSDKQLSFLYQIVFFKNDNWRVYGVINLSIKQLIDCNNFLLILINLQIILCMFWSQAFGQVRWAMSIYTYPDLVPYQILSDRGPCTWPQVLLFWVPYTKPNLVRTVVWKRQGFGADQIDFVIGAIDLSFY